MFLSTRDCAKAMVESRNTERRTRVAGIITSPRRRQALQLFQPVQHHDDVRWCAASAFHLDTADDKEPSIWGDVVGPNPDALDGHCGFEQHLRTARLKRRPGLHR